MSAKFTDYQSTYARKHQAQIDPERDSRLFTEPEPIDESPERLEELKKSIAKVHRTTCEAYATMSLPAKLRPLVSVIIAASNGRASFKASYKTLVELLYRNGGGRRFDTKKSEVRRSLISLRKWQEDKSNPTLCTIRPGGKTKAEGGDEYHDTEFDLVLLEPLAKAMARNLDPEKMRGVVRQEIYDHMRKVAAFDGRWKPRGPSPKQQQENNRRAAISLAMKAAEADGDPVAFIEKLADEMKEKARERFGDPPQTPSPKPVNDEKTKDGKGVGVSVPTHPSGAKSVPIKERIRVLKPDPLPPVEHSPEILKAWEEEEARLRRQPVNVVSMEVARSGTLEDEIEEAGGTSGYF